MDAVLPERIARLRLDEFGQKFGLVALDFVAHAALPVVLTPELVHLLRVNFFLDVKEPLRVTAEADLLLSQLCVELGDGLYELFPSVRNLLLERLAATHGSERLREVASLLWRYSSRFAPWQDRETLERAQQLTALNFLDPAAAAAWLDGAEQGSTAAGMDRRWFVAMRRELAAQREALDNADGGGYDRTRRLLEESLETLRRLGNDRGAADVLYRLGKLDEEHGSLESALELYRQALDSWSLLGDDQHKAIALDALARNAYILGSRTEAEDLYLQKLEALRRIGEDVGVAVTLNDLGRIAAAMGRIEDARNFYRESSEISERVAFDQLTAVASYNWAQLEEAAGDFAAARHLYLTSVELSRQQAEKGSLAASLYRLARLEQGHSQLEDSHVYYSESLELFKELADSRHVGIVSQALASLHAGRGDFESARSLYAQSLAAHERVGDLLSTASVLAELGQVERSIGNYSSAISFLARAVRTRREAALSSDAEVVKKLHELREQIGEESYRRYVAEIVSEDATLRDVLTGETAEPERTGQPALPLIESAPYWAKLLAEADSFGVLLKRLRQARGLSQQALAELVGYSESTILRLEKGRARVSPKLAAVLAEVLDVPAQHQPAFMRAAQMETLLQDSEKLVESPQSSSPSAPGTLPPPVFSLVYREAELAWVTSRLRSPDTQLVTITGPPGIGKTALAVQAAHQLNDTFPDGVYYFGAPHLAPPFSLLLEVARVLGLRIDQDLPPQRELRRAFAGRQMLLVLDAAHEAQYLLAEVLELLSVSPDIKVLATSRTPLSIAGEFVIRLGGLPVPAVGTSRESALQTPAVALFVQAAELGASPSDLTEEHVQTITEIVRLLDGMPWAVQLAGRLFRTRELGLLEPGLQNILGELSSEQPPQESELQNFVKLATGPQDQFPTSRDTPTAPGPAEDNPEPGETEQTPELSSGRTSERRPKSRVQRKHVSDRQWKILEFIRQFTDDHGFPPSVRDIRDALRLRSISVVHYNLSALEARGLIRRAPDATRSIELVEPASRSLITLRYRNTPVVSTKPFPKILFSFGADRDERIELAPALLGRYGQHPDSLFAMRVSGSALADASIIDGDIMIIAEQTVAEAGSTVLAQLLSQDVQEVVVATYFPKAPGMVRLQPLDKNEPALILPEHEVKIMGRVVSVLRHPD